MRKTLISLAVFGVVPGALIAGCSGGGSSGGGFSGTPGAGGALGPITSDLPATDLNPGGYDFESMIANNTAGAGAVAALGSAPISTASLVAYTPLNQTDLLDNGAFTSEQSFPSAPSSIASLQTATDVFAATRDRSINGSGDVYRREDNGGVGTWSVALDTDRSEAYVAAVDTSILALVGGPDQLGEVFAWDDQNQTFTSVATLGSVTPTCAIDHAGVTYLGGTDSDPLGGPAKLFRLNNGALEEVGLPLPAVQAGLNSRQEVTAMLSVSNATQGETLFLAIGLYDLISGAAVGGNLLATDGTEFEQVLTFSQDAPSSLTFHDNTVYAGTLAGRLLHREDSGAWLDEPGLPTSTGITALLSRSDDTLLIGGGSDAGPLVLIRTELAAAPMPGTPAPGTSPAPGAALSYASNVAVVVQNDCFDCHRRRGRVGGNMVLTNPADVNADYQTLQGYVDLGTPTDSEMLVAAQGNNGHPTILAGAGDPSYDALLAWIQQGALP